MKRSHIAVLTAIAFLMVAGSAASAISYSGSKYGQYTYTSGTFISIKDNAADGRFPVVRYKYAGGTQEAAIANKHGYGATVTKNAPSKITAIRPCISRPAPQPVECGGWIY